MPDGFVEVSRAFAAKCKAMFGPLDVCPAVLPRLDPPLKIEQIETLTAVRLLDITASAPYQGLTRRNAPPRFAHIMIKVGDPDTVLRFGVPQATGTAEVPRSEPRGAINLGDYQWGEKRGTLVLAPGYPKGGIDGGHVVFFWDEAGTTVVVSLHAWRPIDAAIATLETMVSSLDG